MDSVLLNLIPKSIELLHCINIFGVAWRTESNLYDFITDSVMYYNYYPLWQFQGSIVRFWKLDIMKDLLELKKRITDPNYASALEEIRNKLNR